MSRSISFLLAFGVLSTACTAQPVSDKFDEIVELTRNSKETYAVVSRNVITLPGEAPVVQWAAEFNQGDLHRVETPLARLIANCRTGEGVYLNLIDDSIDRSEWVAKAACGINANKPLNTKRYIGSRDSEFGRLELLEMSDDENLRTYAVAPNGALIEGTIADLDGTMRVSGTAISLTDELPEEDIFSEASLKKSAVSKKLQEQAISD